MALAHGKARRSCCPLLARVLSCWVPVHEGGAPGWNQEASLAAPVGLGSLVMAAQGTVTMPM